MTVQMTLIISVDGLPYSAINLSSDQPLGQEGAVEGEAAGEALWAFPVASPPNLQHAGPGAFDAPCPLVRPSPSPSSKPHLEADHWGLLGECLLNSLLCLEL